MAQCIASVCLFGLFCGLVGIKRRMADRQGLKYFVSFSLSRSKHVIRHALITFARSS